MPTKILSFVYLILLTSCAGQNKEMAHNAQPHAKNYKESQKKIILFKNKNNTVSDKRALGTLADPKSFETTRSDGEDRTLRLMPDELYYDTYGYESQPVGVF